MRKAICFMLASLLLIPMLLVVGIEKVEAADTFYTVQRGDNLSAIAAQYGVTVTALAQANGIANSNNIYAGQALKVPIASEVNSNNAAPAPTTNEKAYIVQPGDSFYAIANRFGVSPSELAAVNGLSLMSYIYPGQTLRIPDSATAAPAPKPTTAAPVATIAPAPKPASSGKTYTIQSGDSLYAIANRFGTTIDALMAANNIASTSTVIFPGQVLNIPAGGQGGAPTTNNPPASSPAAPPVNAPSSSGKWIDVNLSQQRLVAYDNNKAVFSSLVSTGISRYPTVTGTFNIYVKYQSQAMTGGRGADYYYLPGVPYVMYFYSAYAIHGTYWHNNFGRPMSHGCVNLPTPAAQFMYSWAPVGTPVVVHY